MAGLPFTPADKARLDTLAGARGTTGPAAGQRAVTLAEHQALQAQFAEAVERIRIIEAFLTTLSP